MLELPGVFSLEAEPDTGTFLATLEGAPTDLELTLSFPGAMPVDEWMLVAVTWDGNTGRFEAAARAESGPLLGDVIIDPAFARGVATGDLRVGRGAAPGAEALLGDYGTIVVRDHAIGLAEFNDVLDSRDYLGAYRRPGTGGASWMVHHSLLGRPDGGGTSALPGHDVTDTNYAMVTETGGSPYAIGAVAAVSAGADAFVHVSPFDIGDFFVKDVPDITLPSDVSASLSKLCALVHGAQNAQLRCIVSANSRGVRNANDNLNTWPENYAHGFIENQLEHMSGVLNRPAALATWVERWFGFDSPQGARSSGTIYTLSTPGGHRDLQRCWSGAIAADIGPGSGMFLTEGAIYSLKCQPEPGSLLIAEAPLVVRTHLLRSGPRRRWKSSSASVSTSVARRGWPNASINRLPMSRNRSKVQPATRFSRGSSTTSSQRAKDSTRRDSDDSATSGTTRTSIGTPGWS